MIGLQGVPIHLPIHRLIHRLIHQVLPIHPELPSQNQHGQSQRGHQGHLVAVEHGLIREFVPTRKFNLTRE